MSFHSYGRAMNAYKPSRVKRNKNIGEGLEFTNFCPITNVPCSLGAGESDKESQVFVAQR